MRTKQTWTGFAIITSILLLATFCVAAQEQTPSLAVVRGELISVNPDQQTFSIKDENDQEWTFKYNEETEVLGSDQTVEGLDTVKGSQVTVHYREEDMNRIAAKIEIAP